MASILGLEDARMLREPLPVPATEPRNRRERRDAEAAAAARPDLLRLMADAEARVRRRAALAIGRVGLSEGIGPLETTLHDADPEVRQMAAFALGLIGDRSAVPALIGALADSAPVVQASAAEALGLVGDPAASGPIGALMSGIVQSGALASPPAEADDARRDTPAAAFRLGAYALVRLKAWDALAGAVLDEAGQPRVRGWPVAYAIQRIEDARGFAALMTLSREPHPYTQAFAAKGLGALKDPAALPALLPLLSSPDLMVAVEAVRALGRIGDAAAADPLIAILDDPRADPHVRLEAMTAIGNMAGSEQAIDPVLDRLADPSPAMRAAALAAAARLDPANFPTILSGLDPDTHWSVRAALATVLGRLPGGTGAPRLMAMLQDRDQRVIPSVLAAIAALKLPDAPAILLEHLSADDPVVRGAAATALGELKPGDGAQALAAAYEFGTRDAIGTARAAALGAIANYGAEAARPVLTRALADKDWALRRRAAMLLTSLDPPDAAAVDARIRPAPTRLPPGTYAASRITNPQLSTQAYIDTDRGTIQIELAMNDAPLTVENFVSLARAGFFNGLSIHRVVPDFVIQDGDPRGDGEGGPGYTIRDELNELPYLRGAVGMALDPWPDSGGSQFFITHSPQPHLDAKYTLFGRVVAGMDVVDRIEQWDVIREVRIWDGQQAAVAGGSR
ncbi:MAG: HEAT repeat domain-containing protein [Acidobacteria bacterium]|nr:HEAT repeat domain-containing protein [Acidobacteriota bacterium]